MAKLKDLAQLEDRLVPGHGMCLGCGIPLIFKIVLRATDDPIISAVCAIIGVVGGAWSWGVPIGCEQACREIVCVHSAPPTPYVYSPPWWKFWDWCLSIRYKCPATAYTTPH